MTASGQMRQVYTQVRSKDRLKSLSPQKIHSWAVMPLEISQELITVVDPETRKAEDRPKIASQSEGEHWSVTRHPGYKNRCNNNFQSDWKNLAER